MAADDHASGPRSVGKTAAKSTELLWLTRSSGSDDVESTVMDSAHGVDVGASGGCDLAYETGLDNRC